MYVLLLDRVRAPLISYSLFNSSAGVCGVTEVCKARVCPISPHGQEHLCMFCRHFFGCKKHTLVPTSRLNSHLSKIWRYVCTSSSTYASQRHTSRDYKEIAKVWTSRSILSSMTYTITNLMGLQYETRVTTTCKRHDRFQLIYHYIAIQEQASVSNDYNNHIGSVSVTLSKRAKSPNEILRLDWKLLSMARSARVR